MTRSKLFSLVAVVFVLALIPAAATAQEQEGETPPVDISGAWEFSMEMADGTLNFKQEGTVVTGTLESTQGVLELEGEVEGNEVIFWGYFDAFTLSFYGTVDVEKKEMVGTLEAGENGEMVVDFFAKKKEQQ